ncbi:MAG: 50S ribosomal protein L24 [Dehalococcoidia bacterium]
MRLRKNDTVVVRAGRDRGKRGRIFRIHPDDGVAFVEGINRVKRHMRPKPNVRQAGIIEREAPIYLSNLTLVCPSCEKPTKALIQRGPEKGERSRACKVCQAVIE